MNHLTNRSALTVGTLRSGRHHSKDSTIAVCIFAGTAIVHFAWSWTPSFWYDEAATLRLARLPWPDFLQFIQLRDVVHAFYSAGMHIWIRIFGDSELSARLPSVLAVAFASTGVYHLTRKLRGSTSAGVIAAVVFAFLPRVMIQGVEARSMMIATALVVGAALFAVETTGPRAYLPYVGYLVLIVAAIWCFAYAVLVLPAMLLLADGPLRTTRSRLMRALAAGGIPLVFTAPLILLMLRQQGQVAWLEDQPINLYTILIEPFFNWGVWLAAIFAAVMIVSALRGFRPLERRMWPLWCWMLFPALTLLILTWSGQPLFAPRYVTVSAPSLAVILGLSVERWSPRSLAALGVLWAICATPLWAAARLPEAKPGGINYREIAALIQENAHPGDGFILGNTGTGALRPRNALAAYPSYFSGLVDVTLARPYAETGTFWDDVRPLTPPDLQGVNRVWVVSGTTADSLDNDLRRAGFTQERQTGVGDLDVALWARTEP